MYARPKSKSKGSKRGPWTHSQRLSSQPAEHDGKEQIVYNYMVYRCRKLLYMYRSWTCVMKSFELHDSNLLDYFLGLVSGHNPPTGE